MKKYLILGIVVILVFMFELTACGEKGGGFTLPCGANWSWSINEICEYFHMDKNRCVWGDEDGADTYYIEKLNYSRDGIDYCDGDRVALFGKYEPTKIIYYFDDEKNHDRLTSVYYSYYGEYINCNYAELVNEADKFFGTGKEYSNNHWSWSGAKDGKNIAVEIHEGDGISITIRDTDFIE